MKVFQLEGANGIENLKLAERDTPKPGPGQVLLKMTAASLNYRDLATVMMGRNKLPLVPCSDGCGHVEAVGEGVTRVKAGDRVAPLFFQGWLAGGPDPLLMGATALGGPIDGCLAEYMVLSEQGVTKVPDNLSDEEVACLPCAGLTAWRSLVVEGEIKPGETVLVQGTGGVSIFALQFAKAAGARVIATSSSDEKLDRASKLGADMTINYKQHPEWAKEARRLTDGRGVDHVVEVGGAGTLVQSIMAARVGGHVSIIGILSGFTTDVPVAAIMGGNLKVQGLTVGSRAMFEDMNRALEITKLKPVIGETLPFADTVKAFELMKSAKHFGKIVVKI